MTEMRWRRTLARTSAAACAVIALAVSLSLTAAAAAGAATAPVASATGGCTLGNKGRTLGPTYVTQLSVSHTSCATGMKVIRAYNHCRLASGGVKGYCRSKVLGFRCSEHRPQSSSIQFIAKVRCTKGRAVVTFTYSENT
jgi:hypothetical protein